MAETTGIGWTDSTFNPWVGCSKVSPGCAHCYAETWAERHDSAVWGDEGTRRRTSEANWRKPVLWDRYADAFFRENGHRRRVFCASLADVFEPRPELEPWRHDLFDLIAATPSLDWQLLTKRPEEARDWLRAYYEEDIAPPASRDSLFRLEGDENWTFRDGLGWAVLPNIWIGASVENARFTWRADVLRQIPAAVRFISAEPLVGSLYPAPHPDGIPEAWIVDPRGPDWRRAKKRLDLTGIDWIIVGGESGGRDARPMHPSWAREIRDACLDGVSVVLNHHGGGSRPALFFKQWGSWGVAPDLRNDRDVRDVDGGPLGLARMEYRGAQPKSAGKLLDGREWCEFPETQGVVLA